jgi:aminopeptidase N
LLFDESIIDQVYQTRHVLSFALASQWFGNFIGFRSWSDMWLTTGIAGYMADLFYKKIFGNNEYRWLIMKVRAKGEKKRGSSWFLTRVLPANRKPSMSASAMKARRSAGPTLCTPARS